MSGFSEADKVHAQEHHANEREETERRQEIESATASLTERLAASERDLSEMRRAYEALNQSHGKDVTELTERLRVVEGESERRAEEILKANRMIQDEGEAHEKTQAALTASLATQKNYRMALESLVSRLDVVRRIGKNMLDSEDDQPTGMVAVEEVLPFVRAVAMGYGLCGNDIRAAAAFLSRHASTKGEE